MNSPPRLEFDLCDHPSPATSKVLTYLDAELRSEFDFSLETEYPSVFGEFPGGESLHCSWDGEIVSHVALVARHFIHPSYSLRVGLIGSVVTSEPFRGRGLGRSLIDQALARLKQKGCAIALLWSDRDSFYSKSGFVRAGAERTAQVSPQPTGLIDGPAMIEFDRQKHLGALWRLYSQKTFRFDRSLEEQRRLVSIPRTRVLVTEVAGRVTAYVAVGKGADFQGYVHEWGGDPLHVGSMLLRLAQELPKDQKLGVIAPASEANLFGIPLESSSVATLAWIHVLDPRALRAVYFQMLKTSDVSFRWDSFSHSLFFGSRKVRLETPQDHALGILGSGQQPESGPVLPFFVWGWDSI